jgi:peptide/nickel transport system substrate-binding protein
VVEDPTRTQQETRNDQPAGAGTRLGARLTRRDVLRRGVALGLSAPLISALLAACGGDDDDDDDGGTTAPTATTGGTTAASPTTGGTTAPTAAATTPGGTGATGGTLVIGRDISDLVTFDPAIVYEVSSGPPNEAVYPSLVINDPNDITTFLPVLCEEVPTVENGGISEDLLSYTFKLRQGVKFHTGGEMQAKDFVFMVRRLAYSLGNPAYLTDPFVTKDASGNITEVNVTADDDYTVTYHLAEPNMSTLAVLTGLPGAPYDSEHAKSIGAVDTAEAATDNKAKEWFDNNSSGTGPYMYTSILFEDSVTLDKFPDYQPLGGPYAEVGGYDKIVFKHILGSGQQLQQLQGGEIQVAMELDADAVNTVAGDSSLAVTQGQSQNLVYLALHVDETIGGPLADVKVRQAVAWSVDYDGIINGLLGGNAIQPASPVPFGNLGTDLVQDMAYTRDLDKAKELLAEAGAEGAELLLSFGSNQAYSGVANETLAAKIKADLEEAGFKVELNPMDSDQRLQDFRDAKLQFTFSEWSPSLLDVSDYAGLFGGVEDTAPAKRVGYVSEASTELLAEGLKEPDPAKRAEIYSEVMKNLINDVPFVPLWQVKFQYGHSGATENVIVHPGWLILTHLITPA